MRTFKVHYFLFFAVFMLAAKPFVGFSLVKEIEAGKAPGILIKAFTKRKIEYVEGSSFDIYAIQKRVANPLLALTVLFSGFLIILFPFLFKKTGKVTTGLLNHIHFSLFPPAHRYLLTGKLLI